MWRVCGVHGAFLFSILIEYDYFLLCTAMCVVQCCTMEISYYTMKARDGGVPLVVVIPRHLNDSVL